jgi:hypothetical protein
MATRGSRSMNSERVHRVVIEVHVFVHHDQQPPRRDDAMMLGSDADANGRDERAPPPAVEPPAKTTKRKRKPLRGWPKGATGDRKTVARLALSLTKGKSDPSERAARGRILRWRDRLMAAGMTEQNALFFVELAMIKREQKRKPVRDLESAIARDVKRAAEDLSRIRSEQ